MKMKMKMKSRNYNIMIREAMKILNLLIKIWKIMINNNKYNRMKIININ